MRSPRHKLTYTLLAIAACVALAPAQAIAVSEGARDGAAAAPAATASPAPAAQADAVATFFGPGLYGRRTACGQTLTPALQGLANRTLPCGTLVQVTYGGHTLTVPVLDRGPYNHGVRWDLTSGAATALGITETVRINTRVVGKAPNTPTLGLPAGSSEADLAGGALAG